MTIALYMDEHIHSSITVGLRLRDVDVLTRISHKVVKTGSINCENTIITKLLAV
jgi:hypothetical protein